MKSRAEGCEVLGASCTATCLSCEGERGECELDVPSARWFERAAQRLTCQTALLLRTESKEATAWLVIRNCSSIAAASLSQSWRPS